MVEGELQDIKKHIKEHLAKGYEAGNIKKSLLYAGFSRGLINQAFAELKTPKKKAKPEKKESFWQRMFKPKEKPKQEPKKEKKAKKKKPKKEEKPKEKPKAKKPFLGWLFKPKKEQKPEHKIKPKKKIEPPPPPPAPAKPESRQRFRKRIGIYILLAILLIAVTAALAFLFIAPVSCATKECFIEKANLCEEASYKNKIEGTTVYYETKDCVLTKKIVGLDSEEPPEIVEAFLDKQMTCRYQMNKFNTLYVTTITGLINTCQGPLRDAILQQAI